MRSSRATGLLVLAAFGLVALGGCVPRPRIVAPAHQSSTGLDGATAVHVQLGQVIEPPETFRVTLLRGIDAPPATAVDLTGRFVVNGSLAVASLTAADLAPGRNALYLTLDTDGDGRPENQASSVFRWDPLRAAACVPSRLRDVPHLFPRAGAARTGSGRGQGELVTESRRPVRGWPEAVPGAAGAGRVSWRSRTRCR